MHGPLATGFGVYPSWHSVIPTKKLLTSDDAEKAVECGEKAL
jgi:hypothetical protein